MEALGSWQEVCGLSLRSQLQLSPEFSTCGCSPRSQAAQFFKRASQESNSEKTKQNCICFL